MKKRELKETGETKEEESHSEEYLQGDFSII